MKEKTPSLTDIYKLKNKLKKEGLSDLPYSYLFKLYPYQNEPNFSEIKPVQLTLF